MSKNIDVSITLEGGKIIEKFSQLSISQSINGHHEFQLRFDHDVLERANDILINKSKAYLGKEITILLKEKNGGHHQDNKFSGVITEISSVNEVGSSGDLILKGYSPTFKLEKGEHNASYSQLNLKQIAEKAIGNVPHNSLRVNINPKTKGTVPYIVQYKETAFNFLKRVAAEFGEWFYFDGTSLYFGKPSNSSSINLKYPENISDLNLNLKVAPLKFSQVDYSSKNNEIFQSDSGDQQVGGLDNFGKHALKVSNEIFNEEIISYADKKSPSKSELDQSVRIEVAARAAELVQLTASSDTPYIRLGMTVNIVASKLEGRGSSTDEDFGKFIITQVTHNINGLGNYTNFFEGIPASIEVLPNFNFIKPVAEPQLAVVKHNDDPDNLGRVQVQFLWQKDKETTPWIRVMSMHAGTLSDGGKNRGILFTPEVNDYVLVGFAQNDPDRPFVMGSVPHGKAISSDENSDNHIKSIRTRSGSTILFKDKGDSSEQEIIVKTDDQNMISISIKNDKGVINIKSSKDIVVHSSSTVVVKSNTIDIKGKKVSIDASEKFDLKSPDINIESSQKLQVSGSQVDIAGSVNTKVSSSAQLEIDGGKLASVKAAIVKIN